jgi:hypothetical protein
MSNLTHREEMLREYRKDLISGMSDEELAEKYFNPKSPFYSEPNKNTQSDWLFHQLKNTSNKKTLTELYGRIMFEIRQFLKKRKI